MENEQKDELYLALVRMCQQYGFTTEATYEALHSAVESVTLDTSDD